MRNKLKTEAQTREIIIGIDKEQLRAAAEKYLQASAVWNYVKQLGHFSLSSLPDMWRTVVAIFNCVVAAIEIAKAEIGKTLPDGEKIAPSVALNAAIDILDESITWTGWAGKILDKVDGSILKLLVCVVLGNRHGISWIDQAWDILSLTADDV